jgi:hypothetical protein
MVLAAALLIAGAGCSGKSRPHRRNAPGLIVTGTIVTMDGRLGVVRGGRVVIAQGKVSAVLRPREPLPAAARGFASVRAEGFVFPGLVNVHNHLAFNALPPWRVPLVDGRPLHSASDWRFGGGPYDGVHAQYVKLVRGPKDALMEGGLEAEVGKWAELRELAAGTTTTDGSFGFGVFGGSHDHSGFEPLLVRNLDLEDPRIREGRPGIYAGTQLDVDLLAGSLEAAENRRLDALLVHLSEGTSAAARSELHDLNNFERGPGGRCGPLMRTAVIVHGTAYRAREFSLLARCGADLVVSPLANLLFYGRAPDVPAAIRAGVRVSLSTDWSVVGSRNLLEELKVADFLNRHLWRRALTDRQLVELVTRNPARTIGWQGRVGTIAPGAAGDLLVLRSSRRDPYRALVDATEHDVRLVTVGGDPLFGDTALMKRLKRGDYEQVAGCGFTKAVDVTASAVPKGGEKLGEMKNALARGLRAVGIQAGEPSPLFTCLDRAHFRALADSRALAYYHPALRGLARYVQSFYAQPG